MPRTKLKAPELHALLTEYVTTDVTQRALAEKYGITQAHVCKLLHTPDKHGDLVYAVAAAHDRARGARTRAVDHTAVATDYQTGDYTQVELAAKYGVSQPRIARILARAGVKGRGRRRLTDDQVRAIRGGCIRGQKPTDLAVEYGVSVGLIYQIAQHRVYADVAEGEPEASARAYVEGLAERTEAARVRLLECRTGA